MISWYTKNVGKVNILLTRLIRYELQGSFDQELHPKEIITVFQNMASEIVGLQNELVSRDNIIGVLKVEIENLQKILNQKLVEPKSTNENPS